MLITLTCALLLFACEKDEDKVTYQQGFPPENSPALTDFLQRHILGYGSIFLFEEGDTFTYAIRNMNENENTIKYFQYMSSEFNEYTKRIFPQKIMQVFLMNYLTEKKAFGKQSVMKKMNGYLL